MVVGGAPATNASRLVAPDEAVSVAAPRSRYVGRGGEKLAAALERFDLDLTGRRVLDAGSSTGGFTDCALQAGAASVVAVDVGRGQLHRRLLTDGRVEVHERTNIRAVQPGALGPLADVVVADLSFISLRTVADDLLALVRPHGDLVWLVKPQFEADRAEASAARGVITDPDVWARALRQVAGTLDERGAAIMGLMTSPLRGADGNVEFLLHARAPGPDTVADRARTEALVASVLDEASAP
ncbi:TlyA family rRNA (cytidine-2'-O)-methyltransferase [soil metagenome]